MLPILQTQHRYYTAELARTHQALSKLYRKLAKIEKALAEREERELTRKEKKKLQWAKSVTRSTAHKMEWQQASLQEYLRQCNNLMQSYQASLYHLPQTPWTAHLPPSPYPLFSPYSPIAPNPWSAAGPVGASVNQQRPQYWDLSMLRERRQSSPNASSADSGFYEPAMYGHPFPLVEEGASFDAEHVLAHEIMSASIYSPIVQDSPTPGNRSKKSSLSEKDELPELLSSPLMSPAKAGAVESSPKAAVPSHKRRYSENAIQLIESRLSVPWPQQRGTSVGPVTAERRKVELHVQMSGKREAEDAMTAQ